MKRTKLAISSLTLAVALFFTSIQCISVYADTDPQGKVKSGATTEGSTAPSVLQLMRVVTTILKLI
jgi:hypothetical protein